MPLFPHISRIYLVLENYSLSRPDTFVGAEGYLCYEPGDIPDAPKPDCMVALGLAIPPAEITAANGYTISEIGKPPDFVLEIASMSDGKQDYLAKRETYARFGVAEYWRFDHTGGRYHDAALAGDRLVGDSYGPIPVETGSDGVIRGYNAVLQLELHWYHGRLRFWNPTVGEYLLDLTESKAQRDDAERCAELAETRAKDERAARLSAEARIREL